MAMTKEQLDELKAKHGTIRSAETSVGTLVFRKPTRVEWKKWKILRAGSVAEQVTATETLMLDTIVSHTREALLELFDVAPALDMSPAVDKALTDLSGAVISDEGKS